MCSEPTSFPADGIAADLQVGTEVDHDCSSSPAPLDCGDVDETFRTDRPAAFLLLKTLTPPQLTLQALAYSTYLNQLHTLDLKMGDIMTGCQRDLGFDTR